MLSGVISYSVHAVMNPVNLKVKPSRMKGCSHGSELLVRLDRAEAASFHITREIELINPSCSKMATKLSAPLVTAGWPK